MIYLNPNRFVGGTSLGNLYLRLTADPSQLISGMTAAKESVAESSAMMVKQLETLTVFTTAALAVVAGVSVASYSKFNQAMTESEAIMGNISQSMKDDLESVALTLSTKSVQSAADLAKSYYYIVSAGESAAQAIKLLPVVANFATAGLMDMQEATQYLTNSQIALGLKMADPIANMEEMIRVSDTLTKASIISDATIQQFAEALTNKAAGSMRAYGISVEEGVATLADFANQGIKGSTAGMAYVIVLRDLMNAAAKNATVFKQLGINVYDATGKLQPMSAIVRQLEKAFAGASDEEKIQALTMLGFQQRAQSYILTLLGTSDALAGYEKALNSAGGSTQKVADIMQSSLHSQWVIALHDITAVAIEIGKQLSPDILDLLHNLANMAKSVSDSQRQFGTLSAIINTMTDGVKIIALGFYTVATALDMIASVIISTVHAAFFQLETDYNAIIQLGVAWIATIVNIVQALEQMAKTAVSSASVMADIVKGRYLEAAVLGLNLANDQGKAIQGIYDAVLIGAAKSADILTTTVKQSAEQNKNAIKETIGEIKAQWSQLMDFYAGLQIKAFNTLPSPKISPITGYAETSSTGTSGYDAATSGITQMGNVAGKTTDQIKELLEQTALLKLLVKDFPGGKGKGGVPGEDETAGFSDQLQAVQEGIDAYNQKTTDILGSISPLSKSEQPVDMKSIMDIQGQIHLEKSKFEAEEALRTQDIKNNQQTLDVKAAAVAAYNNRIKALTQEQIDITKEGIEAYNKQTASIISKNTGSAGGILSGISDNNQEIGDAKTQVQQYKDEIAQLKELGQQDIKNNQQILAAKEAAMVAYNNRIKALEEDNALLVTSSFQNMSDALLGIMTTAGIKQGAAYEALFAMTKAAAIATSIVNIQSAIAQTWGDGSNPTIWGKIAAVAEITAMTAGIVTDIESVALNISGSRATGGPVSAGETYLVGEKGPELFSPSADGNIIPNNRLTGGNTNVVINNYSGAKASVSQQQNGNDKTISVLIEQTKDSIASDIYQGKGKIPRMLEKSYGVNRGTR